MSILNKTTNLELTQFSGDLSSFANLYSRYNTDMLIIDGYVDTVNTQLSNMESEIATFEETINTEVENLTTEVGTYSERITTLETCCTDVNTLLDNYGTRIIAIEDVIETVSTQNIEDIIARVDALEEKVDTNTTQISILQDDLGEATDRISVVENTLVTHASQITQLQADVDNLEECCEAVQTTLTAYDTRITQNAVDIDALEARLTRDESNIAGNANDITILATQTNTNTQDIQDLKDAFSELDPTSALEVVRQVAINTTNITNLQSDMSSNTTRVTNLETRCGNIETAATTLAGRVTTLETEFEQIADWQDAIDHATEVAEQASDDVATLTTTVNAFDDRITANATGVSTNADDIDALETRATNLETRCSTIEGNATTLTGRVATNESDILALQTDYTNLEARVTTNEGDIDDLEALVGSADISGVGATVTDALVSVNTKAVNAMSLGNQNSTDIDALEATVGDANSGLVKDVADLQTQNGSETLTTTAQTLSGAVNELDDEVGDIDDRVTAVEKYNNYTVGEEVVIGTFMGKTLYRRIVNGLTANATTGTPRLINFGGENSATAYELAIDTSSWGTIYPVRLYGNANALQRPKTLVTIPCTYNISQQINVWWDEYNTPTIYLRNVNYQDTKFILFCEYTKEQCWDIYS